MDTTLLPPTEYVWVPTLDAWSAEPAPTGARVLNVYLRREFAEDEATRTVLVETADGFASLPRRIHLHGDVDEGWDWGWRGSAPLATALNLLLWFAHPRAAWRLQWAFCEAFLHTLPAAGGVLDGDQIRTWIGQNAWIGRQRPWWDSEDAAAAARVEHAASRSLQPRARAERAAELITRATGAQRRQRHTSLPEAEVDLRRSAAVLNGAPAEQRWSTLALLALNGPETGTPAWRRWREVASPTTAGLPDPVETAAVAAVWSRLVGKPPAARAAIVAEAIRSHAGMPVRWDAVPVIGFALGSALRGDPGQMPCVVGDPVAIAANITALTQMLASEPERADEAASLALHPATLEEQFRAAHAFHLGTLREERRAVEKAAADDGERILAAERARLPRTRSPRPPPASPELKRWILAAPVPLLKELARAARGPAGALTLRAAMHSAGLVFPDPAGTVCACIPWYLEERAPGLLDLPSFLIRSDGLCTAPAPR
jgi:hypothetical protein